MTSLHHVPESRAQTLWLSSTPEAWMVAAAGAIFSERRERSWASDEHLTPSQHYGVLTQGDYMERTGTRVVLNLTGADNMKHVETGDFIIHLRSFQGGIEHSTLPGKVSNAYTVLTPSTHVYPGYYRHLFKSGIFIEQLASLTDQLRDGQSINYGRFCRLRVPIPPLITQRRIADFLDRETAEIDAMDADLDRLIDTLQERRSTLIEHLVRDEEGKFPRVSIQVLAGVGSGLSIPADQIAEAGDYAVYGGNGVRGFTEEYNEETDRVLIGRQGALCGNVHLAKGPFWASEHALVVRPFVDIDLQWLAYTLGALDLGRLSVAAAQPGITASGVGREVVPLPPLDEQRRIADHLDRETAEIDSMIDDARRLKEVLAERRSTLISDVVTGRKEVPA